MLVVVALAIYTMQQILSPRNEQMDKPILGVGFIFNQSIQNIPNIFTNIFLYLHLSGIKVTFLICDYSCEGGPLKEQNIIKSLSKIFNKNIRQYFLLHSFAGERVLSWVRFPELVTSKISLIGCSE